MKARNDDVIAKLRKAYSKDNQEIEIFCVANDEYQECSRKGIELGVNASGIPDLRRRCYLISADAAFLEAKNFLRSTLPGLLESVKLWIGLLGGNGTKPSQEPAINRGDIVHFSASVRSLSSRIGISCLSSQVHNIVQQRLDLKLRSSFGENVSKLIGNELSEEAW